VQADKSREEFLVFLRRNHQREEIDGQESVGRISETPPAVRSAREARRLQLHPEFKLRRLWTVGSAHRYPSAVGLTGVARRLSFVDGRRKVSTRGVVIGISAFVKSGITRTSDREFS
jgi:hypothetical protein